MTDQDGRGRGEILWGIFSPNAPNLIDPDALGMGGAATLAMLRTLNLEPLGPDAIIVISPHWVSEPGFLVDDSPAPRFIEDFTGFPPELYGHVYHPPGDPELARHLIEAGRAAGLDVRPNREWGLDHGAWTALRPLAPTARIPVVALSITPAPPAAHREWGRAVARGIERSGKQVVIVATGLIVHNFARLSFQPGAPVWREGVGIESEILERILRSDVDGVAQFDRARWRQVAPEGDLAPYFVLMGALGPGFTPRLLSNERVFGSAGLSVIEFTPTAARSPSNEGAAPRGPGTGTPTAS